MKINLLYSPKIKLSGVKTSDQMKVENMEHLQYAGEMEEEYLDDELLDKIERGIKRDDHSFRSKRSDLQDSSMYEEYPESKPKLVPRAEVPFVIKGYHEGFSCNVCRRDIYGFRYVCMQCADWDMCASCEARSEHPAHYVLRLPAPKPYAEVQFAIDIIRREFVEKSPGEIRIKKEVEEVFTGPPISNVKRPEITKKNISNVQKPEITKNNISNVKKPEITKSYGKASQPKIYIGAKPEKAKPIVNDAINAKLTFKSKPKPLAIKPKDSVKVSPVLKVAKGSSLEPVPVRTLEYIKKKSPVRKKEEQVLTKVKPIMLKFKVPPGMDSKHILKSLKGGLRVNLDRLPDETVAQSTSKR